jgi:hypothetical protein
MRDIHSEPAPTMAAMDSVTELPPGFPAYLIYVPTGMNRSFETCVLAELKEWGRNMGDNLLVVDWNIGDESYKKLGADIGLTTLPSIVLIDSDKPNKTSENLLIIIDDQNIVRNIVTLVDILPTLVNLILVGRKTDVRETLIDAIKKKQGSKIKSIFKPLSSVLDRVEVLKIGTSGVEFELSKKSS